MAAIAKCNKPILREAVMASGEVATPYEDLTDNLSEHLHAATYRGQDHRTYGSDNTTHKNHHGISNAPKARYNRNDNL